MSNKIFAGVLAIVAVYLVFTQISANMMLTWGFVTGWVFFGVLQLYRHVNTDTDYRFNAGSLFWVELFAFTIVVATTFAIAGKILIA